MKKRMIFRPTYLLWIAMVGILYILGACQKEEKMVYTMKCPVVPKDGPNDDIVGKWKLVGAKQVFNNPQELDHSCDNIVYHFQKEGILTISGNTEGKGCDEGDYPFEFKALKLYDEIEESYTLTMGSTDIACDIKENKLILNNSFLDGDILYLIRVE